MSTRLKRGFYHTGKFYRLIGATMALSVFSGAVYADFPAVIDLEALAQPDQVDGGLFGENYGLFGPSVIGAGDFNGDGKNDISYVTSYISGGPGYASFSSSLQLSYGLFSKIPNGVYTPASRSGSSLWSDSASAGGFAHWTSGSSALGEQEAWPVGDFNGDGYFDISYHASGSATFFGIIPPQNYTVSGGASFGAVKLVTGSDVLQSVDYYSMSIPEIGLGDVDNDGFDDILTYDSGRMKKILFGSPFLPAPGANLISSTSSIFATDLNLSDLFVKSPIVNRAGDINGDGYADFVLYDRTSALQRNTYLFFGGQKYKDLASINPTSDLILGVDYIQIQSSESDTFKNFKGAVGVGDTNGDGFGDLYISMMNPETEVTESCLLYGKPEWTNNTTVHLDEIGFSIPGVRFHGTEHYALKSDTMYPIGDVNSDGLMDILLCGTEVAELTKGVFWIVLGGTGELPNGGAFSVSEIGDRFDGSIIPSSDDLRIFHETSDEHIAGDYFGDLDGDEVDDIVLPMTTAGSYLIRGIRGKESPVYRSAIAMNGSLSPIGSVNGLRGRHNATKLSIKFSGDNGSEVIAAQKFRSSERIFSLESPATALWKVSSPTAEWRNGSVELRYTGEEIGTLNESLLRIYTASSPRGPWTWLEDFHESHPQQNRISTLFLPPDTNTGELYFALAEVFSAKEPAEPVDIAWDIVEIKKIDDADMNRDGLIDSADIVALEIN